MGSRHLFRFSAVACAGLLAYLVASTAPLAAAPGEKGSKGKVFNNKSFGVSARGPDGWKMDADAANRPSEWQRLVTFTDTLTDARAVFSARNRTVAGLDDLLANVRAEWNRNAGKLRVSSLRKIAETALNPIGTVVVDATFVQQPAPPKPTPANPRPPPKPPVTYRVQATYFLGPENEFLLRATGQQTHWGRLRSPLEKLRASVKLAGKVDEGPKGVGVYRNDLHGFSCRFPRNYTVIVPQRDNHLVQFQGVGTRDPVLSVYGFPWEETVERDAERLILYYEEEKGGQASMKREEVSGREALIIRAKAEVGDKVRVVLIALFKRGDQLFRLRASMASGAEAKGEAVFKRFLDGFVLRAAPK